MATLSKQGNEIHRYFSTKYRGLLSVRDNGTILIKTPWSGRWKIALRKKPEISLENWIEAKKDNYLGLAQWKRDIKYIPSFDTLKQWDYDGICETPTGHRVEPDGIGPDRRKENYNAYRLQTYVFSSIPYVCAVSGLH